MLQDIARSKLEGHLREAAALLPIAGRTPADFARQRTSAADLSIGALMRSIVEHAEPQLSRFISAERNFGPAHDEWARADANAEALPAELIGTNGLFAARSGMHDVALIDWDWLRSSSLATRAMSTIPGPKGGYLLGGDVLPAADPLWQDSIIGVGGVQVIEGLTNNCTIPRGNAVTTAWQSTEGTTTTAVDEALGSVSVVAKAVLCTVQASVQLVRQAPSVQDFLARLLLRSLRAAFDTALLQGSGASGQPQGLANLPTASGLQQVSGTTLAWAGVLNAQRLASASGVTDAGMLWCGAPTVRETLAQRERSAQGGRFLWDDGQIAGNRAIATPDAPASTLFVGDFSQAVLALFGPGIEIRFDPHNSYNTGGVAFQVLAIADIVFPQPAAFVRIASIT